MKLKLRFEDVEVPLTQFGNRCGLTELQLVEQPWLADFVAQFQASFEHDQNRQIWLLAEPEGISE